MRQRATQARVLYRIATAAANAGHANTAVASSGANAARAAARGPAAIPSSSSLTASASAQKQREQHDGSIGNSAGKEKQAQQQAQQQIRRTGGGRTLLRPSSSSPSSSARSILHVGETSGGHFSLPSSSSIRSPNVQIHILNNNGDQHPSSHFSFSPRSSSSSSSSSSRSARRRAIRAAAAAGAPPFDITPVRPPPTSLGAVAWDTFFSQGRPLLEHGLLPAYSSGQSHMDGVEVNGNSLHAKAQRALQMVLDEAANVEEQDGEREGKGKKEQDGQVFVIEQQEGSEGVEAESDALLKQLFGPEGAAAAQGDLVILDARTGKEVPLISNGDKAASDTIAEILQANLSSSSAISSDGAASLEKALNSGMHIADSPADIPHDAVAVAVVQVELDVEEQQEGGATKGKPTISSKKIAKAIEQVMHDAKRHLSSFFGSETMVMGDGAGASWRPRIERVSKERFAELVDSLSKSDDSPTPKSSATIAKEHRKIVTEQALAQEREEAMHAAIERGEDPKLASKLGAEAELLVLGEGSGLNATNAQEDTEAGGKRMYYLDAAVGGPGQGFGSISRPNPEWARGTASWLVLKGRPYEVPPAPEAGVSVQEEAQEANAGEEGDTSIHLTPADLQYVSELVASRLSSGSGAGNSNDPSRPANSVNPNDANLLLSRAMVQNSLPASLQWDNVVRKMENTLEKILPAAPGAESPLKNTPPTIDIKLLNADMEEVHMDSVKRKRRKKIRKHK